MVMIICCRCRCRMARASNSYLVFIWSHSILIIYLRWNGETCFIYIYLCWALEHILGLIIFHFSCIHFMYLHIKLNILLLHTRNSSERHSAWYDFDCISCRVFAEFSCMMFMLGNHEDTKTNSSPSSWFWCLKQLFEQTQWWSIYYKHFWFSSKSKVQAIGIPTVPQCFPRWWISSCLRAHHRVNSIHID